MSLSVVEESDSSGLPHDIKAIQLTEFRGFTDLTLTDIPPSARRVMLISPNGTGKSSIFDPLLTWSGANSFGANWDATFHVKQAAKTEFQWNTGIKRVELHEAPPTTPNSWRKLCFFRPAYRHEADFSQGNLAALPDPLERRLNRTIENDAAVAFNYPHLIMQKIKVVWGIGEGQTLP